MSNHFFTEKLMEWFSTHQRPLPWKGEKDPYFIWLSEIILQQTQVGQGLPYFERFKAAYPTVHDLANASEDEVMKRWQGLGYYSRARNLHATAKYVSYTLRGNFPDTVKGLLALRGVGEYTAAAIASFAYGLPEAVVDGNVYRVLTRFFGIDLPIDKAKGQKAVKVLARQLLNNDDPGGYNQAIMDFGATQCKPRQPLCASCPLQTRCVAFSENKIAFLPLKAKKMERTVRYFNYLVISFENRLYLQKRMEKDIWEGLYQFPLIETKGMPEHGEIEKKIMTRELFKTHKPLIKCKSGPFYQNLSHQKIVGMFYQIQLERQLSLNERSIIEVERKKIKKFAVPRIIDWFLADKSLYLAL